MRLVRIIETQQAACAVVVEAMHVVALVEDNEWIVNALRLRLGFVDRDGLAELAQQIDQTRAVALQVGCVVQRDLDYVSAARQQEGAQQIVPPRAVVPSAKLPVEDPQPAACACEQRVERLFQLGVGFQPTLLWCGFAYRSLRDVGRAVARRLR